MSTLKLKSLVFKVEFAFYKRNSKLLDLISGLAGLYFLQPQALSVIWQYFNTL